MLQWFGDAEKLTKALFSLARKLSPSVIFVDEVRFLFIYKQNRGQGSSCNLLIVCCDEVLWAIGAKDQLEKICSWPCSYFWLSEKILVGFKEEI
jgi:SpoVK/Ycf46/Vps4 family AAA+-type ATPase